MVAADARKLEPGTEELRGEVVQLSDLSSFFNLPDWIRTQMNGEKREKRKRGSTPRTPSPSDSSRSPSLKSVGSFDSLPSECGSMSSPTEVTIIAKKFSYGSVLKGRNIPDCNLKPEKHSAETTCSSQSMTTTATFDSAPQTSDPGIMEKLKIWGPTLWPCVLYGSCACLLHLGNKAFFSFWDFTGTFTFPLVQSVVVCSFMGLAATAGLWKLPPIDRSAVIQMLPLSLLGIANTVFGLLGLRHCSLPMYLVLRRMVTPMVLLCEYLCWGNKQSTAVVSSLGLLALGSIVAGASDMNLDIYGYGCTVLANILTVTYTMYMKELSSGKMGPKREVFEIMFYNSFFTVPALGVVSAVTGEFSQTLQYQHLHAVGFQASLLLASSMAIIYQLSAVWCTTKNSPLALSIAGNVKDIVASAGGFFFFGTSHSLLNCVGLVISFAGAYWYILLKARAAIPRADKLVSKPKQE